MTSSTRPLVPKERQTGIDRLRSPGSWSGERTGARPHPLAVVSMILAAVGFLGVPVLPGLVAAPLGALARRIISRRPERWSGRQLATAGVVVGLVGGCVPLAALALARSDDWGLLPLGAVLAYAALVVTVALPGGPEAGRHRLAAAVATVGIGAALVMVVFMMVLAVGFFFEFVARGVVRAFTDSLREAF